jgi:hypothetical protein
MRSVLGGSDGVGTAGPQSTAHDAALAGTAAHSARRCTQLGGDELAGIRSPEIRSADHLPAGIGGVWGGAAGLGSLMAAGSWRLAAGGSWWLVADGWWLVAGGWT